jgi:hypothetical protein
MPYQMSWAVEKRVILTTFSGKLTQTEFEQFIESMSMYVNQGQTPVHHISNSLGLEKVDIPLHKLRLLVKAYGMTTHMGWQVDINNNSLNKMLVSLSTQFVGIRARTFSTLNEAVTFIKQLDLTLENSEWCLPEPVLTQPTTE